MTSRLLVGYKGALLREMSLECSSFIVLQLTQHLLLSSLSSPSCLKDQTLRRIQLKQLRESPYVAEHFSSRQTNTKSARLSVIPEDRSSASPVLVIRRPCSVVTSLMAVAVNWGSRSEMTFCGRP